MRICQSPRCRGGHGIIAWDALLNGMAMGLFLVAAISELAAPAVFMRVAKVAYPVALVLLLVDLVLLVLDLGDPSAFSSHAQGFQAQLAYVFGDVVSDDLSLPLTVAAALSLLAEWGVGLRVGSLTRGGRGPVAWLWRCSVQGRPAQHKCTTGLERRALAGRLSHQFGPPDGLRRVACPIRRDAANAGDLYPPHHLYRVARAQCDSLGLLFANLRPIHAQLYTREQQWRIGALIAGGALIPLGLMLLNGSLLSISVAVIFLLAESWLVRSVYVKIPHTSPLGVRSGE